MALQSSQVCDGPLPLALRPCSPTTYVTRPWLLWCTSTGDGKASGDPSLRAGRAQSGRTRTGQAVPTPTPAADCDPCDRSRDDMTKHDVSATTALLLLPLGESALWHSAVPSPAAILRGNRYVSRGRDACAGTGEEARPRQLARGPVDGSHHGRTGGGGGPFRPSPQAGGGRWQPCVPAHFAWQPPPGGDDRIVARRQIGAGPQPAATDARSRPNRPR